MKKTILALGSAVMLFASTPVQAEENMSFGVKGLGSFFMPVVKDASQTSQLYKEGAGVTSSRTDLFKNFEGNTNMFVGGSVYGEYILDDYNMSIGAEIGYSRKGFSMDFKNLTEQTSGAVVEKTGLHTQDAPKYDSFENERIGYYVHALDLSIPFSFFPMGQEEGLSVFIGPKFYFSLAEEAVKDKNEPKKEVKKAKVSQEKAPRIMSPFNVGLTGGVEYEFADTGFFVGASYEAFFLDTFNNSKEAKDVKDTFVKKDDRDKAFPIHGAQIFVGFDIASLF